MRLLLSLVLVLLLNTSLYAQKVSPLGQGLKCQGLINDMAYDSSNHVLCAGGYFDGMNEKTIRNIAIYDGMNWDSLGNGVEGPVYCVEASNGKIYAGGSFNVIGQPLLTNLAMWDGTAWQSITNAPLNGTVWDLKVFNGDLYATGTFNYIDGANSDYVARYSGGAWYAVGTGFDYPPSKMEIANGRLYFNGGFETFNNDSAYRIAWVDSAGNTDGMKVSSAAQTGSYTDITVLNDTLYFLRTDSIFKFDGGNSSFHFYNSNLQPTRIFNYDNSIAINYDSSYSSGGTNQDEYILRKTQNNQLSDLVCSSRISGTGAHFIPEFYSFLTVGNSTYIAGNFNKINDVIRPGIINVQSGLVTNPGKCCVGYLDPWANASARCMVKDIATGDIYVGGSFIFAGNKLCSNIARWDGTEWYPLDSGFSSTVRSIEIYNGDLYAAGNFVNAGNTVVNGLARWDGSKWNSVQNGANKPIVKLLRANQYLYLAGAFTTIGGTAISYLAKFDGVTFTAVGNTPPGYVVDIAKVNNELYCAVQYDDVYKKLNNLWIAINLPNEPLVLYPSGDTLFVGSYTNVFSVYQNTITTIIIPGAGTWDSYWILPIQHIPIGIDGFYNGTMELVNDTLHYLEYNLKIYSALDLMPGRSIAGGFFPSYYVSGKDVTINNICLLEFTPPQATISVNRDSICEYQYIFNYCLTDDHFAKFDWNLPGGIPDSSSQQNPIVQYVNQGNYPVELKISNLAGSTTVTLSGGIHVSACNTSIENPDKNSIATISPNPFSDQITIANHSESVLKIKIRSITGTIIYSTQVEGFETHIIQPGHLAEGLYLAEMTSEAFSSTIKLVRQ